MLIGSRQRISTFQATPALTINNVPVKQVPHTKSVGTHIDENLSWNVHIEKLCKKVAFGIGAIKRIRPYVHFATMKLIYNCLIQPYFDYCSITWDSCGSTLADKLQKFQNRVARVLTSSSYDTNADYWLEKAGISAQDGKAIRVYKSLNGLAPDYLSEMFVDRSSITNYALRDTGGKLALPQPRTNYLKNSFGYSGAALWNSLPAELRQASTLHKFRFDCSNFF